MKNVYTDRVEEYHALRGTCGLIDHEGAALVTVAGPAAAGYLSTVTTRSVDFLLEGQSVAALLLTDEGSVISEVLVHCRSEDYLIQVWPAQATIARDHLLASAAAHPGARVADVGDEFSVLALEGPRSFAMAGRYLDFPISSMAYRTHTTTTWNGAPMLLSRSGVTGEYGYALIVPADQAGALRTELIEGGAIPCGQDAVDTCRMEMRFVNIEQEGAASATPFHLGLQWMVDFSGSFTGRDRLLERWTSGPGRSLVCWQACEDGPPSGDTAATWGGLPVSLEGIIVGDIAHAVHSPALDRIIGTARVEPAVSASGLEFTVGEATVRTISAPFLVATSFGMAMD